MQNLAKTVIAAILLTLIAGTAAASPANIDIFPSQSSTRIDHFTEFEVTVENSGPVKDTYELTSSNPSELGIAPSEVTLEPGQEETVNAWYDPQIDKEEGTYTFSVTATSRASGQSYSDSAQISVIKEHKVDVQVDSASKTGCLGENVEYRITVTNNGIQQESFDLETDRGSLSVNSVDLEDGETQNVTLVLSSDSPVERNFNVIAESQSSYAQDIQNIDFAAERCWASEVSVTPQSQQTAAKTEAEYEVTVRNTGTRADTFTLSSSTGTLGDTSLEIGPKSSAKTTLTLAPQEPGETSVEITAESEVTATTTATLNAVNGMNMELSADSQVNVCENEDAEVEATLRNTGAAEETFTLNSSEGELETDSLTLEVNESEEFELELDNRTPGSYAVDITSTAQSFGQPEKSTTTTVNVENCWDLDMSVVPSVAKVGNNTSTIYEVTLTNNGTQENTYELSHDGPSWVSIKPSEVTVSPSESKNAFIYAGLPHGYDGELSITSKAEGTEIVRSQTVELVTGEVETPDQNGGLTGSFARGISSTVERLTGPESSKLLLSLVVGLGITALVLLREW